MNDPQARRCTEDRQRPGGLRRSDWLAAPAPEAAGQPGEEPALGCYLRCLVRHKSLLVLCAIAGLLAGLGFSAAQTPRYRAAAWIEVQGFNEDFLNLQELSPVGGGGRRGRGIDLPTQVKILRSRELLERVAARMGASGVSPKRPAALASVASLVGWTPPHAAPEAGLREIERSLRVRALDGTRIIEISCESADPEAAARFANTLADEFIAYSTESRRSEIRQTEQWLQTQLEQMRSKLQASEDRLQRFARETGLTHASGTETAEEEDLRRLQEAMAEARIERIEKQSRYELALSSPAGSLPEILDHGPLRQYQIRLTDLRRKHAELASSYTQQHYKVRRIRAQIEQLEQSIRGERTKITKRIQNEFEAAQRRERMLAAGYRNQARRVSEGAAQAVRYNLLQREAGTTRAIYEDLLRKVREAGIAAAVRARPARIADPARPPETPHRPRHGVNGALGLLTGLLFAAAAVVARSRLDRRLHEPGEAAAHLQLPELGVIPQSQESEAPGRLRRPYVVRVRWRRGGEDRGPQGLHVQLGRRRPETGVELAAADRGPSLMAESFRAVLTSILYSGGGGKDRRLVLVTSPSPGEGKTTVVSNLGVALAGIGRRVLLIDADVRRPRLHALHGAPLTPGLAGCLEQGPHQRFLRAEAVRPTQTPGLFVLPAGEAGASFASLLHSERASGLLAEARRDFDFVLVDTPPVLQIADARVLGRLADAVVLVFRAGRTSRDCAHAAAARLWQDGVPLLGTVLNSWDSKHSPYPYYGERRSRADGFLRRVAV